MDVVVVGGGMIGLSMAMLLAGDGHGVTVLERDPAPPPAPAEAWEAWERRGVNQFRLLHFLLPRHRALLEAELPAVAGALKAAGALDANPAAEAPDSITGGARPGDERFASLTARRPVVESVLGAVAEATPGLSIRRGTAVAGLVTGPSAIPGVVHVTGVRTDAGDTLAADLVVDAGGRRSRMPDLIEAAGGRRPVEERDDCGFVYYGRHFRSDDGSVPPALGPLLQDYGSISVLTLPADNGTWGVGVITSGRDTALRGLSRADRWAAVVSAHPLVAHWQDGHPLEEGPTVMAGIEDRHRSYRVDGQWAATGVVAVGDAWACTNPSLGRGISIGTIQAVAFHDALREAADPSDVMSGWERATAGMAEPWFRATLGYDRTRLSAIEALMTGAPGPSDPKFELTEALKVAALRDPDCFRAFLDIVGVLALPEERLADPELLGKVIELGGGWRDEPVLGPDRHALMALASA